MAPPWLLAHFPTPHRLHSLRRFRPKRGSGGWPGLRRRTAFRGGCARPAFLGGSGWQMFRWARFESPPFLAAAPTRLFSAHLLLTESGDECFAQRGSCFIGRSLTRIWHVLAIANLPGDFGETSTRVGVTRPSLRRVRQISMRRRPTYTKLGHSCPSSALATCRTKEQQWVKIVWPPNPSTQVGS